MRRAVVVLCGLVLVLPLAAQRKAGMTRAPRIWTEEALKDWYTPVAGINARPDHYTEAEYYAAPADNLRTYPVYHPDREPPGYLESLRKRGPEPMIEVGKARTREGWIEAGRRVWDEYDTLLIRTVDARLVDYVRSAEALRKYPARMTKDGQLFDFRWVVERNGELKLSLRECSGCHTQVRPDGTTITGGQGNPPTGATWHCPNKNCPVSAPSVGVMLSGFSFPKAPGEAPDGPAEGAYAAFAAPWIPHDTHERIKSMTPEQVQALTDADLPETFARFNGSPYYTTKIPSLIGVHRSPYLDHTGTHRNRGPEDIARYAALVSIADDGAIGPHRFLTAYQRKLRVRLTDDALYALGMFITYGLREPENQHKPDEVSRRGEEVFRRSGCPACHTPPNYTNGMLIAVDGFTPPAETDLAILRGIRVGTDPGLALRTRKGTGYYKVPSLVGLWHRRVVEHSGSVTLEDWFDPKRLRDDYVPTGWRGPGVTHRAVPGHEFGLDLPAEEKHTLIAFLKTL